MIINWVGIDCAASLRNEQSISPRLDHGINGLEFDDVGNLYIQVGGNTNAGVEGALSQTYLQKEGKLPV